jgi:DNA-binding NarL/FixJ family response regulator
MEWRCKVHFLTAHSDRLTVERAKRTDHDGFIPKPFRRDDLQSTIRAAMLRRARRAKKKMQ